MDNNTARRTQWSRSNNKMSHEEEIERESELDRSRSRNGSMPRTKSKSNMRLLMRSFAIKESTSPPPDIALSPVNCPNSSENLSVANHNNNNNIATINNNSNGRLEVSQEHSNEGSGSNTCTSLSRANSTEQPSSDQSCADLEQFIVETLNKNTKDRQFLLRLEADLVNLAKDSKKTAIKFGIMTSYQRMLVHRVAHYFGMEHNVDSSGQMVIVNKGKNFRVPEKFSKFLRDDVPLSGEEPRRSILKRDSASFEETTSFKSSHRRDAESLRRSKSYEEREEEYEKARRRIFHQEHASHRENNEFSGSQSWISHVWSADSEDSSKLHPNSNRMSRLTKVESYESKDTLKANSLRSSFSKSYSFGGYDQNAQNTRVLSKQDSGSSMNSRISPLSSGYKSQSLRSDTLSATPSPSITPHLANQMSGQSNTSPEPDQPTVVWAVTNMGSVPAGSMLINPQSGEPYTNEDGSIYHYDPENPPNLERNSVESTGSRPQYNLVSGDSMSQEDAEINTIMTEAPQENPPITEDNGLVNHVEMNGPHEVFKQPIQQPTAMHAMPPTAGVFHPGIPQTFATPHQQYNSFGMGLPRFPHEGNSQDLSGYMMGLNLAEAERMNPQPHQMCFCNPTTTPHPAAVPMPQNNAVPMVIRMPPQFPPTAPPNPYNAFKYGPNSYQPDQPGTADNLSQQSVQLPGFLRVQNNSHMNTTNIYPGMPTNVPSNCMMGYIPMPPPPPMPITPTPARNYHQHMTPPNTPQNGCSQFSMMGNSFGSPMQGCYQHCQAGNVPLTPVMRPAIQLNMCSSPPIQSINRFNAPIRPFMIDQTNRGRNETSQFMQHTARPGGMYRFGNPDLVIMGNPRRSNIQNPASSFRRRTRY